MQFNLRTIYTGDSSIEIGVHFDVRPHFKAVHLQVDKHHRYAKTLNTQFEYVALSLGVEALMRWRTEPEELTFYVHTPRRKKGAVELAPQLSVFKVEPCAYRAGYVARRLAHQILA